MKKLFFPLVILFTCSILPADNDYLNKIAYIRGGEVWISDINGKNQVQLTDSGGQVNGFAFSPTLKYLAYNDTVLKLYDKSEIRLGSDMEGYSAIADKWFADEEIIYHLGGEYDVGDMILYNIMNKSKKSVYTGDARYKYVEGAVSRDRSMVIYTQERFPAGLFLTDRNTGKEKTLLEVKSFYEDIRISNDNQYALSLSCKNFLGGGSIDERVWVLVLVNLKTGEPRVILSFKNKWSYKFGYAFSNDCRQIGLVQKTDKGTNKVSSYDINSGSMKEITEIELSETDRYGFNRRYFNWDPEDHFIMVSTFENNKFNTAIVDFKKPERIKYLNEIRSFTWIDGGKFLYNENYDLYLYDLRRDKKTLFSKSSVHPVLLKSVEQK